MKGKPIGVTVAVVISLRIVLFISMIFVLFTLGMDFVVCDGSVTILVIDLNFDTRYLF